MYQPNLPRPEAHPPNPRRRTRQNVVKLNPDNRAKSSVSQLPRNTVLPIWLRSLLTIERGASMMFASVFTLSIIVYAYTVHTQNSWKQQYSKLNRIKGQERQQVVMTEILNHQHAQLAEQSHSGLKQPDPQQIVTIPSVSPRPAKSDPTMEQSITVPPSKPPLGY